MAIENWVTDPSEPGRTYMDGSRAEVKDYFDASGKLDLSNTSKLWGDPNFGYSFGIPGGAALDPARAQQLWNSNPAGAHNFLANLTGLTGNDPYSRNASSWKSFMPDGTDPKWWQGVEAENNRYNAINEQSSKGDSGFFGADNLRMLSMFLAGTGGLAAMAGGGSMFGGSDLAGGAFDMGGMPEYTSPDFGSTGSFDTGGMPEYTSPNEFPGNAFDEGGMPKYESPGTEGLPPVEDRSRMFNPATSGGMPDFGNMVSAVMKNGGIGLPTGGKTVGGLPWSMISGGMDIGSGIMGLMQKKKMQDMATQAFSQYKNMSDPYARVKALMANPGSVSGQPGYQFGMDEGRRAIARTGAAGGSGGNEAIALARYTPEYAQNFYNNEVARLMSLGQGESQVGTTNATIGINAQNSADRLMSSSLGSIGYGANRMMNSGGGDMVMRMLRSAFGG